MNGEKWWLNSSTVQGTLLALVPTFVSLAHIFGITIANGEAETIVNGIAGLCGLFGAVTAIIGRFKADTTLSLDKPKQ